MAERIGMDPRLLYKNAGIGLCCFDTDLRFLDINDWLARLSGLPADDHLSKTVGDVWPHIAQDVENSLRHVIATGEPVVDKLFTLEDPASRPNGQSIYKHSYAPVWTEDGVIAGVSAVVEDVTANMRQGAAPHQLESWMQTFLEQTSDWLWEMDADQRYTYLSEKYYQLTGDAEDAVIGKTSAQLGRVYESEAARESVNEAMANRQPFRDVFSRRTIHGGRVWWTQSSGTPVFDSQGGFCGYRGISRDVTAGKRRDDELRATTKLLQTILENAPSSISFRDRDGRIVFVNDHGARRLGVSPEELVGKTMKDVFGPDKIVVTETMVARVIATGQPIHNQTFTTEHLPGREFLGNMIPIHGDDGRLSGVISTVQDITKVRKTEDELKRLFSVLDRLPDIVSIYDANDRLVYTNGALFPVLDEIERAALIGMTFAQVMRRVVNAGLITDAIGCEDAWLKERIQVHRDPREPIKYHRHDGVIFLIYEQRLEDGSTIAIGHDITEAEVAQEARLEIEARYRDIVEGSLQGIVVHRDLVPLYANDAVVRMFGYDSLEDFLRVGGVDALIHPDDARMLSRRVVERETGEDISEFTEFRGIRKDGGIVWFITSGRRN